MSTFDPDTFMSAEVQGANETEYSPVPAGEWTAYISDVKPAERTRKDGTGTFVVADVIYTITDERVIKAMEEDEPTCKQSLFLDFEENGALAFGKNKNVQLGKLREAAGQNDPTKPWSFRNLISTGPYKVKVEHDDEGKYANVVAVVRAS